MNTARAFGLPNEKHGFIVCPTPNCGTNLGKFTQSGAYCSCGDFVSPSYNILKHRIRVVQSAKTYPLNRVKGVGKLPKKIREPITVTRAEFNKENASERWKDHSLFDVSANMADEAF